MAKRKTPEETETHTVLVVVGAAKSGDRGKLGNQHPQTQARGVPAASEFSLSVMFERRLKCSGLF